MKLGILSSWNSKCGISEYTRDLVYGLKEKGIDVKVCGNFNDSPVYPDEDFVSRLFHCPFMTHKTHSDPLQIYNFLADCDILHVQFETSLYHPSWFPRLLRNFKQFSPKTKIVFTMHSSGIWDGFDTKLVDHYITHEKMWCTNSVIPMGVKFYEDTEYDPKLITSFGLGRNRDELVNACINGTDLKFEPSYGHNKWLSKEELSKAVNRGWAVSLIYPSVGANVSSSASIFALGFNRPLIISDTNWFHHINNLPGVYPVDDEFSLKDLLRYLFDPKNKEEILMRLEFRKKGIINSGRTFDDFINKHIQVYQSLNH